MGHGDIDFIKSVLKDNFPNEGKYSNILEQKIAKLFKAKYAITTTSGTIAIFLSLKALGINNNDEVIIPDLTFPATANAVHLTGATPILADISKKTLNIKVECRFHLFTMGVAFQALC